ncbi:MAG: winged helix-turn-helix transcriptional regulator [archaeon]
MRELEDPLALESRNSIYKSISKNPGLHFRELQRRTKLAVGTLQYHLDYLQKNHLVRGEREGKFVRFYSVRAKTIGEETKIMPLLRHESMRHIVLYLMEKQRATNKVIARETGLSPSTVSWHLKKLAESGVIIKKRSGKKSFFSVANKSDVGKLLVHYRKSFLDGLVDGFAEIWKEEYLVEK